MSKLEKAERELKIEEARLKLYMQSAYFDPIVQDFLLDRVDRAHGNLRNAQREAELTGPGVRV